MSEPQHMRLMPGRGMRKAREMEELGISGLRQSGGYIDQEFLGKLRGRTGIQQYIEMRDNDPIVGAMLFAISMLIRNASWTVVPGEDSQEGRGDADFIKGNLADMNPSWDDTVASVLSFLWAGFSLNEVVLKKRSGDETDELLTSAFSDGRFGWRSILGRAQETIDHWQYDDKNRRVIGAWQNAPPDHQDVFIPSGRTLNFRTTTQNQNPEGRSILRNAYVPYTRKKRIELMEGVGIERDLAGLPVAWLPPEYLAPDAPAELKAVRTEVEKIVRSIHMDERSSVVFPLEYDDEAHQKKFDLTLLSTGGRRQYDTSAIITRYDQRIAMTVLADFILIGHSDTGSFALMDEKTNVFGFALGTFTGEIAQVMNRQAIPRLMRINGMRRAKYPQLKPGDVESPNLKELGDYVAKLAGVGAVLFPTREGELEKVLMEAANLPTSEPVAVE